MLTLPSILLWAFATCVSAVMMATHIRRRREQLTGQLRQYVERHLGPRDSPEAADGDATAGDATIGDAAGGNAATGRNSL